jgi:hypothetical protein
MKRPRKTSPRPVQLLDQATLAVVTGGTEPRRSYGRQTDADIRDMNPGT